MSFHVRPIIHVFIAATIALALWMLPRPAEATTYLLNTGTGTFDNWSIGNGQSMGGSFDATDQGTITSVNLLMNSGYTGTDLAGSTVGIYSNWPTVPSGATGRIGLLSYSSIVTEGSYTRASFTGSVSIPSAGTYWFSFGDMAPTKTVRVRLGNASNSGAWNSHSGTAAVFLNSTAYTQATYFPMVTMTGTVGAGGGASSSGGDSASTEAARTPISHTLTLTGGGCTSTPVTGEEGTWVELPTTCSRIDPSVTLLGWATDPSFPALMAKVHASQTKGAFDGRIHGARMIFIPAGGSALLSSSNTLHAILAS